MYFKRQEGKALDDHCVNLGRKGIKKALEIDI